MSEARVYVNGQEACFWPFGYNSFHCNVTPFLNKDGKNNTLAVSYTHLDVYKRQEYSSRLLPQPISGIHSCHTMGV